jgi:hypothetical protein
MPKVIYEFVLSQDGKCSIAVKSDDPLALKAALPLARQLQAGLSEIDAAASSTPPASQPRTPEPDTQQPRVPVCGVHSTPMTQVEGKHGLFWSCHQRTLDGNWCRYKPARQRRDIPGVGGAQLLGL